MFLTCHRKDVQHSHRSIVFFYCFFLTKRWKSMSYKNATILNVMLSPQCNGWHFSEDSVRTPVYVCLSKVLNYDKRSPSCGLRGKGPIFPSAPAEFSAALVAQRHFELKQVKLPWRLRQQWRNLPWQVEPGSKWAPDPSADSRGGSAKDHRVTVCVASLWPSASWKCFILLEEKDQTEW